MSTTHPAYDVPHDAGVAFGKPFELSVLVEPPISDPIWDEQTPIILGARPPKIMNLTWVIADAWQHPRQLIEKELPVGHDILSSLIPSYDRARDRSGKRYRVGQKDAINGHFGLREIIWLEETWPTVPKPFREWSRGKLLCGWASVARNKCGHLSVPCFRNDVADPHVCWAYLSVLCGASKLALREGHPRA